jgi:hypothetical protein
LLLSRIPLQVRQGTAPFTEIFKQNFLAEVITFNLAFATLGIMVAAMALTISQIA